MQVCLNSSSPDLQVGLRKAFFTFTLKFRMMLSKALLNFKCLTYFMIRWNETSLGDFRISESEEFYSFRIRCPTADCVRLPSQLAIGIYWPLHLIVIPPTMAEVKWLWRSSINPPFDRGKLQCFRVWNCVMLGGENLLFLFLSSSIMSCMVSRRQRIDPRIAQRRIDIV